MKKSLRLFVAFIILLPMAAVAPAQDQGGQQDKKQVHQIIIEDSGQSAQEAKVVAGEMGQNTFYFVSSEMGIDGKVVKGAPYSAQTVSTFTQMLSDGNQIFRQNSGAVYRDSEGRTRREQSFAAMGPFASENDAPQTTFINDPVSGVNYILNAKDHTASKMTMRLRVKNTGGGDKGIVSVDTFKAGPLPTIALAGPMNTFQIRARGGDSSDNVKTESLGTQMIEGVQAQGTRTTITIPAGKIGNQGPIQIVTESWYSPDLQVTVMTRHSDPMTGETVYKLTNIDRSEPAPTLFTVPSDYTIKDGPSIGADFKSMRFKDGDPSTVTLRTQDPSNK